MKINIARYNLPVWKKEVERGGIGIPPINQPLPPRRELDHYWLIYLGGFCLEITLEKAMHIVRWPGRGNREG